MPLIETKGAASSQGFGQFASTGEAVYIESVFSTYLYTGTGSSQTITNNIDTSTKGGLVWIKGRSGATGHRLTDTVRGATKSLESNSTAAEATESTGLTAFGTTGFTIGADADYNTNAATYVSWTFRKQAKFFDVVTYTGNGGTSGRTITHALGSVPGCIIVKNTTSSEDWYVYHRSLGNTGTKQYFCILNSIAAQDTGGYGMEKASNWTATQFALVAGSSALNVSGQTYVAYLFAHDAGGFGLTGSDNVISCGSYTGNGSTGQLINLGYEPQWVLVKKSASPDSPNSSWALIDNMRGWAQSDSATLEANTSNAENAGFSASGTTSLDPLGFRLWNANGALNRSGDTYIYIAIRRGPMKVPTSGTSVFAPVVATSGTATTNFPVDMQILSDKGYINANLNQQFVDRLRGASSTTTQQGVYLISSSTAAESSTYPYSSKQWSNTGFGIPQNYEGASSLYLSFRRAPGFFDVVCYTGTGSNTTQTHNLGVVPELIIVKRRDTTGAWDTYSAALSNTEYLVVNTTAAKATGATRWNSTTPTSTVFSLGTSTTTNASGGTYVAYLFATCAGVSKVGTYTGTGALQTINCGFTGGARFVLIKRTDSTGDWYVYDSARGISSGNDPYLLLNSTAAEVTGTNYVDTDSTGFKVTAAAPAGLNANGGSFVFLAIA